MKSKPAPAPWRVRAADNEISVIEASDGAIVCEVNLLHHNRNGLANTALIVASPRLRDALRDILPLAEAYLGKAPSHPDNAKLEEARGLLIDLLPEARDA